MSVKFGIFMSQTTLIQTGQKACNHYIYDYMGLLVICDYLWTFLQLFLMFGHICN
jgi:hypothetical protein